MHIGRIIITTGLFILIELTAVLADTVPVKRQLESGSGSMMPTRQVTTTAQAVSTSEVKSKPIEPTYLRPYDIQRISIFAFAGTKCPVDSLPYKGIQAAHAEGTGAIYCIMKVEKIYPFMKAYVKDGKCPPPLVPYLDQKYKPDDDAIWCQFQATGGKAYDLREHH